MMGWIYMLCSHTYVGDSLNSVRISFICKVYTHTHTHKEVSNATTDYKNGLMLKLTKTKISAGLFMFIVKCYQKNKC